MTCTEQFDDCSARRKKICARSCGVAPNFTMAGLDPATQPTRVGAANDSSQCFEQFCSRMESFRSRTLACWVAGHGEGRGAACPPLQAGGPKGRTVGFGYRCSAHKKGKGGLFCPRKSQCFRGNFTNRRPFSVAPQRSWRHIIAMRYRGYPLRDAAALPGRFLPELGRSFGSGLFIRRRAAAGSGAAAKHPSPSDRPSRARCASAPRRIWRRAPRALHRDRGCD